MLYHIIILFLYFLYNPFHDFYNFWGLFLGWIYLSFYYNNKYWKKNLNIIRQP